MRRDAAASRSSYEVRNRTNATPSAAATTTATTSAAVSATVTATV
jgi:hypothetical protein